MQLFDRPHMLFELPVSVAVHTPFKCIARPPHHHMNAQQTPNMWAAAINDNNSVHQNIHLK